MNGTIQRLRAALAGAIAPKRPPLGQRVRRERPMVNFTAAAGGVETYKRMERDPQIALALALIKAPVARAKWHAACEDGQVREFVEANLRRIWRRMTLRSLDAVPFGFQAFEKVWGLRDGKFVLEKLVDVDPSAVVMRSDERGAFAGFRVGEETLPAPKAFVFTHQKRWGDLYGRSRLEPIVDVWHWSRCVYDLTNRYYERKGDPPIKGRAPSGSVTGADGTPVDNLRWMEEKLLSLKSNGVFVVPAEMLDEKGNLAWDYEYQLDDQRAPMFLEYLRHLDALKMRGLFVPERTATQDKGTGSYAMAETHRDVFLGTEDLLAEEYEEQVNEYVVRPLVELNFDRRAECSVRIARMADEERDRLWRVADKMLQGAEAAKVMEMIDREKVLEGLDIPLAKAGEGRERP